LNATGDYVVYASLQIDSANLDELSSHEIWVSSNGVLESRVRSGSIAPGTGGGRFRSPGGAHFNDAGDFVCRGELQEGANGVSRDNNQGVWATSEGVLQLIARSGSEAPETGGAPFQYFQTVHINNAGDIAYEGLLGAGGTSGGIWLHKDDSTKLIARAGERAPDTAGAVFEQFSWKDLNDQGEIAFRGILQIDKNGVDDSNNEGIWATSGGSVRLVVREGSAAPGADGTEFRSFVQPVFNNMGDFAFEASVRAGTRGVDSTNNSGLWVYVSDLDRIVFVVREGDSFDASLAQDGSSPRTIRSVFFDRDGSDGSSGFNDAGQVAYTLHFTDGSSGVFVTTLPSASSCQDRKSVV